VSEAGGAAGKVARVGLVAGPVVFAAMLALPAPPGLGAVGWRVAAAGVWMGIWWMTEALPLAATSLLPLLLFPLLGAGTAAQAAAPYAEPTVFLFMGGFMLALAMQRWGLHRRIALTIMRGMSDRPAGLVLGTMAATAFISMWVNNTATVLMMLPIGLSVIEVVERCERDEPNFAPALLLGIVYAAAVGGLGTLIGTPPNALLAGFLDKTYGIQVDFVSWMKVGVPLVVVLLPVAWLVVTRMILPLGRARIAGSRDFLLAERAALGAVTRPEWIVAVTFVAADVLWIARPALQGVLPGLSDAGIAIGAAVLLFALPAGKGRGPVLTWETAGRLPWDVLLLFGGGLSLAAAIGRSGLAAWIGGGLAGVGRWPDFAVAIAVAVVLVVLSEVASNTAAAVTFLPVIASLAVSQGESPLALAVIATLAASGGFILPVASPPNAIVYGTGKVSMRQMARGGIVMDLVFALLVPVIALALIRLVW
jgi:solute carrier family 13 (sodium-dependent dicarboxylate transporter), member 2/3/5